MIFSRIFRTARRAERDGGTAFIGSVSRTHVGLVRKINEDRILDRPERRLWAVADGMGGHSSGDVAAQIAIDHLDALKRTGTTHILDALQAANAAIFARFGAQGQRSGTTLVAAHIDKSNLNLFWAGDSRAYRVRGGMLDLLTRDHSVVQEMVDAGVLAPDAAAGHPKSNVITRALGVESKVVIDHITVPIRSGDRILLCSDGISRSLGDKAPSSLSLASLAQALLDGALSMDGSDNASLVLIAVP